MEISLKKIVGKSNDFKICKRCNEINWYENEGCTICGNKTFNEIGKGIVKWADKQWKFWKKKRV